MSDFMQVLSVTVIAV